MLNNQTYLQTIEEACGKLRATFKDFKPTVAVILGSGLGDFAKNLKNAQEISYAQVPGFFGSEVVGHASKIIYGDMGSVKVLVFSGRMHGYEGHELRTVTLPVRLAGVCGVKHLLLTNAAGGIREDFVPGDFMLLTDQINLTGQNVLVGPNLADFGPRFNDMTEPFDLNHRESLLKFARQQGIQLHEGVYIGVSGSCYETKAEIRAFRTLGADAVGMSTVHEVIAARHHGLRVAGISLISNKAAGLSKEPISHEEVMEATQSRGKVLSNFLRDWIIAQAPQLT